RAPLDHPRADAVRRHRPERGREHRPPGAGRGEARGRAPAPGALRRAVDGGGSRQPGVHRAPQRERALPRPVRGLLLGRLAGLGAVDAAAGAGHGRRPHHGLVRGGRRRGVRRSALAQPAAVAAARRRQRRDARGRRRQVQGRRRPGGRAHGPGGPQRRRRLGREAHGQRRLAEGHHGHQAARPRDAERRGRQEPRGRRQDLVPLGPRRRRGAHPRRQARRQLPGRAGRGRQRPRRTRPLLRQVAGGRLLAEGQPRRRRDLALGRRAAARPLGERGRRGRGRRAGHGVARGEPPLPAAVLGGAERRPPRRARRADGGRRRRGELRRRAQPLGRARHRARGAQARRREPEPAARPRGANDDGRRLRRQPRPRPQVRLRGDTMTPHAHPNARVLAIVAVLLAALTGLAAAQSWEPQGEIEVLTGEVMVGETAQVLVHFEAGLDFDPTLHWGDGTSDDVDRFSWPTVALEHVYTTPGLKTLEFRLEAMGDAYLMDTQYLYVRPEPELDLSATSLLVGETVTATVVGGPEGGRLEWGDGAFEVLGGFEVEEYEHAYGAPGVYTVRLLDWGGDTLVTAFVNVTTG